MQKNASRTLKVFLILCLLISGLAYAVWDSWPYERNETAYSNVTSSLAFFPAFVMIDTTDATRYNHTNNCTSMRYSNSAKTSAVDYDYDFGCNTSLTGIWRVIPTFTNGTLLREQRGNISALSGENETVVWTQGSYENVSHMIKLNTTHIYDVAGKSLWYAFNTTNSSNGKYGAAQYFQGTETIALGNFDLSTQGQPFSLSMWIKTNQSGTENSVGSIMSKRNGTNTFDLHLVGGNLTIAPGFSGLYTWVAKINTNTWQHIALTYDGAYCRLYVNGTLQKVNGSATQTAFGCTLGSQNILNGTSLGSFDSGRNRAYEGLIDEFRVSNTNLTADWLLAEYRSGDSVFDHEANIIFACQELNVDNDLYFLQQDILESADSCFGISAKNVSLDCQSHKIAGNNLSATYGVYSTQINSTIRNCIISNFSAGIVLNSANSSLIQNNTINITYLNGEGIKLDGGISGICYQETATTPTACGGLDTGIYGSVGLWFDPEVNTRDADWDTYGNTYPNEAGTLRVNYTRPPGAQNNSMWQIKTTDGTENISMNAICWDAFTNTTSLELASVYINANPATIVRCRNATTFIDIKTNTGGSQIFEEGMWWNISGASVGNASFNTIRNNTLHVSNGTAFSLTENTMNNSFYHNNATALYWINDSGASNKFNTTGAGNIYYLTSGTASWDAYDIYCASPVLAPCWATGGSDRPFSSATTTQWKNSGQDWFPYTENNDTAGNLTSCSVLNASGRYNLIVNLSVISSCMIINSSDIILDCLSNYIDGDGGATDYAISDVDVQPWLNFTNITIRNCNITDWGGSVEFMAVNRIDNLEISNSRISGNERGAILSISAKDNTTWSNITIKNSVFNSITAYSTAGAFQTNASVLIDNLSIYNNVIFRNASGSGTNRGVFAYNVNNSLIYSNNETVVGNDATATDYGLYLANFTNSLIYNNTFICNITTSTNGCIQFATAADNVTIWNNTIKSNRNWVYGDILTGISFNSSGTGNTYLWYNNTNSWEVYETLDIDGNNWADIGGNVPFNSTQINRNDWNFSVGGIVDYHPATKNYAEIKSISILPEHPNKLSLLRCNVTINSTNKTAFNASISWVKNDVMYSTVNNIQFQNNTATYTNFLLNPFITEYGDNWSCQVSNTNYYSSKVVIGNCTNITTPNSEYTLTEDTNECFEIQAENVSFNCAGYSITGNQTNYSRAIYSNFANTTVKNCIILGFDNGIVYEKGRNGLIENNTINTTLNNTDEYSTLFIYSPAILLWNLTNSTVVRNNNVSSLYGHAIRNVHGCFNTTIENNYIHNGYGAGISIGINSNWTIVANNTISNITLAGVIIQGSNNTVANNTITGSSMYAMSFSTTGYIVANSNVTNNTLNNTNATGIGLYFASDTRNITAWQNNITASKWVSNANSTNNFNTTGTGNAYYLTDGTPSWDAFSISAYPSGNWANFGAARPFNASNTPNDWVGLGGDWHPYTENNYLSCGGNFDLANTVYNLSSDVSVNGSTCFTMTTQNITLDCANYAITGNNSTATYGVYSNQLNSTVANCKISNFSTGIYINGDAADYANITNNTLNITYNTSCSYSNGACNAIFLTGADYSTIQNNYVYATYYGITLYSSATYNNITSNNVSTRNNYAVCIMLSDFNNISYNNISASSDAIYLRSAMNNNVTNNYASTTGDYAIFLNLLVDNSAFSNNTFVAGNSTNAETVLYIRVTSDNNTFIYNNLTGAIWVNDEGNNYYNNSAAGNIYYFPNGTGSWEVFDITTVSPPDWADGGSARPFNASNVAGNWTGEGNDSHPWTENSPFLDCSELSTLNTVYNLTRNISNSGASCFNVTAVNITLNCAGFSIDGDNTTDTYGIYTQKLNTSILNCVISNFSTGIYYLNSSNGTIRNNTINITYTGGNGIKIG